MELLSKTFQEKMEEARQKIDILFGKTNAAEPTKTEDDLNDIDISTEKTKTTTPVLFTNFKLPITYLQPETIHTLTPIVSTDLELIPTGETTSMYEHLLQPKHIFATQMISEWNKQYTTDTTFLTHSQEIIQTIPSYRLDMKSNEYVLKYENIEKIWKDVKQNDSFLDYYGYMDWDMLLHLNNSTSFLQSLSVINVSSPLISLFIPFIFLVFPFILLKIQGVPITFTVYIQVLKDIAKSHFIGRALSTLDSLSWDKVIYLLVTLGLYLLQIYQNANLCIRFYKNVQKINQSLLEIRNFTEYSIHSMNCFIEISKGKTSYIQFCKSVEKHRDYLVELQNELEHVLPFEKNLKKFWEVGYLLKCYYSLYSNPTYDAGLRYAFGFEGYINNLVGIYENIEKQHITMATFVVIEKKPDTVPVCEFKSQYYPPLLGENPVKNSCSFEKNMIISSPNKSGKTTILKTTTINIIFTQQFGCGFYEHAKLTPYTHIHSYLNIPDTSGRDSLFQAESRRCKEILDIIKSNCGEQHRHFCIFDELYSGTNPEEACKAGYAFLKFLSSHTNVNFILTTHYFAICKKFLKSSVIQNYKMDVRVLEDGTFDYTYKIKRGISKIKGAIRVLKDMDYPSEIIDTIENN